MRNEVQRRGSLSRLLGLKRALDRSLGVDRGAPVPPSPEETESPPPIRCINCGYEQRGQRLDGCPECGLPLASRLRDPTPWALPGYRLLTWWQTAAGVWTWDYRTRVRTSLVPTAPESRAFARWSVGASSAIAGLAVALSNYDNRAPSAVLLPIFGLHTFFGILFTAAMLIVVRLALGLTIRGTWRSRLPFVPASVDYATAWWPPISLLLLVCTARLEGFDPLLKAYLVGCGVWVWMFWLWSSASESQHVRRVGLRIAGVTLASLGLGLLVAGLIPGASRALALQALSQTGSALTRVNAFATIAGAPSGNGPRTLAVVIDAIPGPDDPTVTEGIRTLGADPDSSVVIRGKNCTLEQIERLLQAAVNDLRPQDRFILYVNGHGSQYGAGSIQMADGEITTQKLTDLLSRVQTANCLVVIDSCFGGKFMAPLRRTIDGIIITSSDTDNVGYMSGMTEFWHALGSRGADSDGDGRTTVEEAFWCAYRPMLLQGEVKRQANLARSIRPETTALFNEAGYATPQLEKSYKTRGDLFSVPVSLGN